MANDFLNKCSKCGGCQAVCPLYGETQAEPYVARGKIFLIKNYLEGKIELSPKMKEIMSLCLLCKACVESCPNQVPVDRLVLAARREIARERGISFVKKNVFQHLLQNNGSLSLAARMGYLYQHSGAQGLVRKSGLLKLISPDLAKKEGLLPNVARRSFRRQVSRLGSLQTATDQGGLLYGLSHQLRLSRDRFGGARSAQAQRGGGRHSRTVVLRNSGPDER